jgi:hypothetical protein
MPIFSINFIFKQIKLIHSLSYVSCYLKWNCFYYPEDDCKKENYPRVYILLKIDA